MSVTFFSTVPSIKTDLPWVTGHFQDRSLEANVQNLVVPVAEYGDTSMIDGNKFVVPEDGLYLLSAVGWNSPSSPTRKHIRFSLNDGGVSTTNTQGGMAHTDSASSGPSLTSALRLLKGDSIFVYLNPLTEVSTIAATYPFRFLFKRIA